MLACLSNKNNGFTLLELLVAISIFAIMSVMAYGGLSNVIDNSESSKRSLLRLQEVQQAMINIERDFSQLTERGIRDELGTSQSHLITNANTGLLVELTRNGRRNPAKLLRSHLVRVAYKLEEGQLTRLYWPQLDRVQGMEPYENILLNEVDNAEIRFLDSNKEWHTEWPLLDASGPAGTADITLTAIEFIITMNDWGEIRRLFKVQS